MKKKIAYLTLLLSICGIALFLLFANGQRLVLQKHLFYRMDTVTEISLMAPSGYDIIGLWKKIDLMLEECERKFSLSHKDSEIRALNERKKSTVPVEPELAQMIKAGIDYGDTLNGMFDITILPLKELWGLGEGSAPLSEVPDSVKISEALFKVNFRDISLNEEMDHITFENPQTKLDLGGLAKSFVIKKVEKIIREHGFTDYLIVAGGDIAISGQRDEDTPWRIGIQHPRDRSGILAAVDLDRGAIVTSGDYERYSVIEGQRYHHIFNPKTGYSCKKNQSLTIWAPDVVAADILSTGLFCLPADKIIEFIEQREKIECIVVTSEGKVHISKGWKQRVMVKP